eukprot:CAMPEP_0116996104 /NCGR_PEP_ID=MMETSP0472-20121206/36_1 /TAXON_ID=693140 ORGANISM="Tiarina fusus, Strain LIS" /NCGR_SAMPLE_ID=MMETSP0472 /ASSEMBLY_ACC=CAM_ASM_000603 /LENGTH=523 /DNA_ID=CAMNT_0004694643 /DNA_START=67 /DNA_END=1635 /DNA_ORIENTATION=+
MNSEDSAYVLYVDHQGHPAPLSLSYHATASRRLAAAIDRHPPSTITEVDSAFCPQCLSFHDSNTAGTMGYCPKPSCRLCPLCRSVASIAIDEQDCLYKCGRCEWTSHQCSLYTPIVVGADGSVAKEDIEKAAIELGTQLTAKLDQQNQWAEEHYKTMLQTLELMAKDQVKGQRSTTFIPYTAAANRRGMDGPEGWSVQSLEESLEARQKLVAASVAETVGGQDVQLVSLEFGQPLNESLDGKPSSSLLLQAGATATQSAESLLPLPIPLRPRKSRRCRAELAEGRPGILVKPKLNPLEGDSSLRTGHGQWWKKDSSAIQVLPRARVSIHASDGTRHAFLLKITNPTLGKIRLRLAPSRYPGEPTWDDASKTTPLLEKLLLDPMTQQYTDAQLVPELVAKLEATLSCQLEPAEDTFLELGRSGNEEPPEVAGWDAGDVLFDSKVTPENNQSTLKLVGNKNSCAWYELVVLEPNIGNGINSAIPLSLQIEVGDGSWESSLIQPDSLESGPNTVSFMVSFDIVLIW